MTTIHDMMNKLSSLNVEDAAIVSTENTLQEYEALNIKQFSEGLQASGMELPDYSQTSINVYGKPPGPWRLFETGDFYRGVKAMVEGMDILTTSTDEKTAMLEGKVTKKLGSADLFGLTEASRELYINEDLQPEFVRIIKRRLS